MSYKIKAIHDHKDVNVKLWMFFFDLLPSNERTTIKDMYDQNVPLEYHVLCGSGSFYV